MHSMISIQILFCYLSYHKPHEQIHVLLVLTVSFFSLLISLYISFARPVWLSVFLSHVLSGFQVQFCILIIVIMINQPVKTFYCA